MDYQVWTKDDYEGWKRVDCGDLEAARREILQATMRGEVPLLTVAVPYDFNIKIKEDKIGEVKESKPTRVKGAGDESKGEVRSGDMGAVSELDKRSGDNSPGDSVSSQ